jgi:hypothetical protein
MSSEVKPPRLVDMGADTRAQMRALREAAAGRGVATRSLLRWAIEELDARKALIPSIDGTPYVLREAARLVMEHASRHREEQLQQPGVRRGLQVLQVAHVSAEGHVTTVDVTAMPEPERILAATTISLLTTPGGEA